MTLRNYILDDHGEPQPVQSFMEWCKWWTRNEGKDRIAGTQVGEACVSTVFLRSDHNFGFRGGPILWETMVFGGKMDQDQDRCGGSREQAEAMHHRMVAKVEEAEGVKA